MAQALRAGLRNGGLRRGGLRPGLGNGSLFAIAPLDLFFARNRTLDPRVTFTRASSGTYVGSDGLIKTATTNLLLRSEEFDNAYWTKNNSCTITANADVAPNGTLTADQFNGAALASTGVYVFPATSAGLVYTFSIYVKNVSNATTLRVGVESNPVNAFVTFNATTGVITSAAANVTSSSVSNVGNNWYRVSLTYTATGATAGIVIYSMSGSAATWLAWGAQLEQSSTVGEYIPTTSTINSAPRFDHNPTTGESLGLLVEEQRTNSIRNNTMVGAVAGTPGTLPTNWFIGGAGAGTLSRTISVGEQAGISYVDIRYFGTTSTTSFILAFETQTQVAALTGQTWTSSIYLALVGGSTANINTLRHDLVERTSAGAIVLQNFSPDLKSSLSASLVRSTYAVTLSGGATTAALQPSIEFSFASGVAIDITLRIGLPQLEQGAFATSVIPTSTVAVTRSADVASISGTNFSSWYRQDEGTVFADVSVLSTARFNQTISLNDGTNNNRVELRPVGSLATNIRSDCVIAGVTKYSNTAITVTDQQRRVGTLAVKVNDFRLQSGSSGISPTSDAVPVVDRLYLNYATFAGGEINGTIRRLTYWPARLSNSVLQTLTQ